MGCGTGGWGASSSPDSAQGQDRVEIFAFVCGLMKRQYAVDSLELGRLDQTRMGDRHGMERPLQPSTPRPAEYGDMFQKGIIDPAKVVHAVLKIPRRLQVFLTTPEAKVPESPKKAPAAPKGRHRLLRPDCYEPYQKARE